MSLTVGRQRESQRLFGAGLADRASDADEFGMAARARHASKRTQSLKHVGNGQQWRVGRQSTTLIRGDNGKPRAGAERRLDEVVPVASIALDCEERLARRDGAGVDRQPRHACG